MRQGTPMQTAWLLLLLTGTSLRYRPGVIICGPGLLHDCGTGRSVGWFMEPLIILALFAKKVSITACFQAQTLHWTVCNVTQRTRCSSLCID